MTYVKICGLTNLDDARAALDAGADYLGFIFYEKSPRYVTLEQVESITARLPSDALTVGVFVDAPLAFIAEARARCNFKLIQLHGQESLQTMEAVGSAYKAIRPANISECERLATLYLSVKSSVAGNMQEVLVPDLLVDTYHPTMHGGTGITVQHDIGLAARSHTERLMLAGGLTPDNVAGIVQMVRPFAVDVSSGVESSPGKKDRGKLQALVRVVREIN